MWLFCRHSACFKIGVVNREDLPLAETPHWIGADRMEVCHE